ncbi:MAG TPA: hypothetical protein DCW52_09175 [Gammaproteobacteria bacterium]|jgi:hypothetical protein|nr:hypothetical protein [Gammaproteobacteria bacterium]
MSFHEISLNPEQFLAAFNEQLNNRFYALSRAESKILYQQLIDGEPEPFMQIDAGEGGEVICDLVLDYSEHVGKMSFSKFRKGLAMMMLNIKNRLDEKKSLNPMSSDTGEVLFNVPGVLQETDATNVIVCSFAQAGPGRATLKLMYLNPESYVQAAAAVSDQIAAQ